MRCDLNERNSFETHATESLEATNEELYILQTCDIRCIVCKKQLQFAGPEDKEHKIQPYGGIMCSSHGNFGSTVFDPYCSDHNAELLFLVCDECLMERRSEVVVFVSKREQAQPMSVDEYFSTQA
jgi:hypothetical protein